MTASTPPSDSDHPLPTKAASIVANEDRKKSRVKLLETYSWLIYVLPLAVFMLVTQFEPALPGKDAAREALIPYRWYPAIYTAKLLLTAAAVAYVWPGYRQHPLRLTWLWLPVGLVGGLVWIGLCELHLEQRFITAVGLDKWLSIGQRSAFNPLEQLAGNPALAYGFLAIRLTGLVLLVPLIEEMFLRGFLMRFVMRHDWWRIPIGQVNATAIAVGTLVPVLMHGVNEYVAAAVWFSLITWLMIRTRNIWDCVAAHAVTNLVLGIYVIATGHWRLM